VIIQLSGPATANIGAAEHDLADLATSWGHDLSPAPVATPEAATRTDGKVIDPISITTLILSLPSVALAVRDLTDRISKRQRAKELIDRAHHLHTHDEITLTLITADHPVELTSLNPDQLLDLLESDDSPRPDDSQPAAASSPVRAAVDNPAVHLDQ
jgi:hypothetical protein